LFHCNELRSSIPLAIPAHVLQATNAPVKRNNAPSVQVGTASSSSGSAHNSDSNIVSITTNDFNTNLSGPEVAGGPLVRLLRNLRTLLQTLVEHLNHSETLKLVKKTINDCERRKMNIIISGIPQSNSKSDDHAQIADLVSTNLNLDMHSRILAIRRLGSEVNVSKIRRILVTLDTPFTAAEILSHARRLRNSHDDYTKANVFINPDLSNDDDKLAYERRCQRRNPRAPSEPSTDTRPGRNQARAAYNTDRTFWRSTTAINHTSPFNINPIITVPSLVGSNTSVAPSYNVLNYPPLLIPHNSMDSAPFQTSSVPDPVPGRPNRPC